MNVSNKNQKRRKQIKYYCDNIIENKDIFKSNLKL